MPNETASWRRDSLSGRECSFACESKMRVGSLVRVIDPDGHMETRLIGQVGLVFKIKPSLTRKGATCYWVLMEDEEHEAFYPDELREI